MASDLQVVVAHVFHRHVVDVAHDLQVHCMRSMNKLGYLFFVQRLTKTLVRGCESFVLALS